MASREVFGHLVELNPSLLVAIRLCRGGSNPGAAPAEQKEQSPQPKDRTPAPVYWPGFRWPVA